MNAHLKGQLLRFARLFLVALAVQLPVGHLDRSAVIAAVVAALETAYRQWKKTERTN